MENTSSGMLKPEEIQNLKTVQYMAALSDQQKLEMLKEAKGGTWYDDWHPYCMTCSYGGRMKKRDYGFQCPQCKNMIGWDCTRLQESPLNKPNHFDPGLYPPYRK